MKKKELKKIGESFVKGVVCKEKIGRKVKNNGEVLSRVQNEK